MAIDDLDRMIGATLLVRVTYLAADGTVEHVAEFAGVVTSVDPLVAIDCGADEPFTLPPDPDGFDVGMTGEYHLHTTGEIVVSPDYTTTWTVHAPEPL